MMDDAALKSHNAITAVVAFYGAALADAARHEQLLRQANEQLAAQVQELTAQGKKQADIITALREQWAHQTVKE